MTANSGTSPRRWPPGKLRDKNLAIKPGPYLA